MRNGTTLKAHLWRYRSVDSFRLRTSFQCAHARRVPLGEIGVEVSGISERAAETEATSLHKVSQEASRVM